MHFNMTQSCLETDRPQQRVVLIEMPCVYAGVVQLLNSGHLPHDFWDWDFSAGFSWGPDADEEEVQPAEAAAGKQMLAVVLAQFLLLMLMVLNFFPTTA